MPSKVNILFFDYSQFTEDEKQKRVNKVLVEDSRKVFDLRMVRYIVFILIMTGSDEYYFRISIHHIIFDGWSWSVFAKDLNKFTIVC